MNETEYAYCGLICVECPAYIAKQTNDDKLRASTVEKWSSPEFPLSLDDINCVGCKTIEGDHFRFCAQCTVRKCASEHDVITCAHCSEYICDTLENFLNQADDELRGKLDQIHKQI